MLLLMAQVDDVPGEVVGEFIQRAGALGAKNVHVVPSITKKNRPGFVIYVDTPASLESDIAALLGAELGTWGYRVIAAEHKHFEIERFTVQAAVRTARTEQVFEVRAKRISQGGEFLRVKAEYDDLSRICESLRESGARVSLSDVKASVESALRNDEQARRITVTI